MDLSKLKLYATRPHPCSYLPDEEATTIFIDPMAKINAATYSELSHYGFRRSGGNIYRPHCENCQACIPIRLLSDQFRPNRSQKRCWKTNSDLSFHLTDTIDTDEHYQLYEKYIHLRHKDGDMYPPDRHQYVDFLTSEWDITRYIEMRDRNGKLLCLAVTDIIDNGLSAVYTFFDPEEVKRSLGVFAVLYQLELARQTQLPYLYLGYWIRRSQKMNYKSNYRPYQVLINDNWVTVTDDAPNNTIKHQLL